MPALGIPYFLSSYQVGFSEYERLIHAVFPENLVDDLRPVSGFVSFSAGIVPKSPLFVAFVEGLGGNITRQIAVKMSLDAISTKVLELSSQTSSTLNASELLKSALKNANGQVYQYGQRMQAGGQFGATVMVLTLSGNKCALGRVGPYAAFLWREGKLQSFYETTTELSHHHSGRFLGANAQIPVDLCAVTVRDGDVVILASLPPSEKLFSLAQKVLCEMTSLDEVTREFSYELLGSLLEDRQEVIESQHSDGTRTMSLSTSRHDLVLEKNIYVSMLQIGPPTIELREVVV